MAEELWVMFCELSNCRMGGRRLTFLDIAAYCSVHRIRLERWEVEAIKRLDVAMLNPKDHTEEDP